MSASSRRTGLWPPHPIRATLAAAAIWSALGGATPMGDAAFAQEVAAAGEENVAAESGVGEEMAIEEEYLPEYYPPNTDDPAYKSAVAIGQALYANHCANCHGAAGDGEGSASYLVYPKPRDFRSGAFRFRSTKSGQLPMVGDLARTIRNGLPGTAMPAYGKLLSDSEIEALATYLTTYSERFLDDYEYEDMEVVQVPAPPAKFTPAMITRGAEVYALLGCAECHGPEGRGDGPSASKMLDERGYPAPPKDFGAGVFKSGGAHEDIYRSVATGLNGTGMPAYGDLFAPSVGLLKGEEDAWALAAYVKSLSRRSSPLPGGEGAGAVIAVAKAAADAMMDDPFHPGWEEIQPSSVALRPLWARGDYPAALAVRSATRGDRIAFLLEWDDATKNAGSIGPTDFPDKASIAFPLADGLPFIGMGSWTKDEEKSRQSVVNIWCWRADVDADREAGRFGDLASKYPLARVDWYPFKRGWKPGEPEDMAADLAEDHNPTFLTAWGAGNPVADPQRPESEITEFDAAGFGTLTAQPPREQHVAGRGEWKVGRWRVLFVRDAYTGGDGDAILTGRRPRAPIAFAIWDGAYNDRDGIKSISNWHWLSFEEEKR